MEAYRRELEYHGHRIPLERSLSQKQEALLLQQLPLRKRLALHLYGHVYITKLQAEHGYLDIYLCEAGDKMWLDYPHGFDEVFYIPSGSR